METALDRLLATWETNYKKGLLTLWLLLALHERERYAFELSDQVNEISLGSMSADGNSIYRALSRFEEMGLVASHWSGSEIGPDRRYYRLTPLGHELLRSFIRRNLLLLQHQEIQDRLQAALDENPAVWEDDDGGA